MAGGFWVHATEDPSYIAVVDPDGTEHTAGELLARSNQLVHGLRALGLQPGDAIAEILPNGVAPVELFLAATQAGLYLTPINFHLTGPEIAYIVEGLRGEGGLRAPALRRRWHRGGRRARLPEGRAVRVRNLRRGRWHPGLPFGRGARRRTTDDGTRRSSTRADDALHVGHHRSAEGCAPRAARRRRRRQRRDELAVPHAVRHPAEGRQRPSRSPRRTTTPRSRRSAATRCTPGHTLVFMDKWQPRRHAREDREVRRHPHPHGPDPVPPDARPPRRRARQVRRVVDEMGDPRGRAVSRRREAQDARLVGSRDLRVLRRDRRRWHARHAGAVARAPGHRRYRVADLDAAHRRRRRATTSRPGRRAPST